MNTYKIPLAYWCQLSHQMVVSRCTSGWHISPTCSDIMDVSQICAGSWKICSPYWIVWLPHHLDCPGLWNRLPLAHSNISAVARVKALNKSGCFPGLDRGGWGTPPNPDIVNRNEEKERTVKSSRNSVYGAPESSCSLELPMKGCHGQSCDLLKLVAFTRWLM